MVYVIIIAKFPHSKAKEVGKKYLEVVKQYPVDKTLEKQVFRGAIRSTGDVITTIGITEPKEGKLKEFILRQQKAQALYHDIEGLQYTIEVWHNLVEALEVIGLEAPKE
jgi:hypothetical protein